MGARKLDFGCPRCGEPAADHAARFCEYCGFELIPLESPSEAEERSAHRSRYEWLLEHPDLPRCMTSNPDLPRPFPVRALVFGSLLLSGAVLLLVLSATLADNLEAAGSPEFIALAVLVVLIFGSFPLFKRRVRKRAAPLLRRPTVVVAEREDVSDGEDLAGVQFEHYATLEFEGGRRVEFRMTPQLAETLSAGDAGVAFLKLDRFVAFHALAV